MNRFLILLFSAHFFFSCADKAEENSSPKVASVGNVFLHEDELLNEIPKGLNPSDSLKFIEQYIHHWTKEQVILLKAEEVLPEESKNVKERLENYRKSLLIHTYEQAYIENRLDTTINDDEIKNYYESNSKDFTLKGYIIKGYYAQFPDSIDKANINQWYKLNAPEDYINLLSFSQIHANDFHLDTTNWIYFDKVMEKIPLENNIHVSSFIKHKKHISFEENNTTFFINVVDYKLKDETSPLAFEKEKIKTIILNQRTQKLRKELNESLYKDALSKQQIVIYNKK